MNQLEAASIIEKQAIKSLAYKFDNKLIHPIRLIQASKSLIGLDLDNPNQKLLKFNSDYLDNNEYQKFDNRNFIVNNCFLAGMIFFNLIPIIALMLVCAIISILHSYF